MRLEKIADLAQQLERGMGGEGAFAPLSTYSLSVQSHGLLVTMSLELHDGTGRSALVQSAVDWQTEARMAELNEDAFRFMAKVLHEQLMAQHQRAKKGTDED